MGEVSSVFVAVCMSDGCKHVIHADNKNELIRDISVHLKSYPYHTEGNTFAQPKHELEVCECYEQAHGIYITAGMRYRRAELLRLRRLWLIELDKWERLMGGARDAIITEGTNRDRSDEPRDYSVNGRPY